MRTNLKSLYTTLKRTEMSPAFCRILLQIPTIYENLDKLFTYMSQTTKMHTYIKTQNFICILKICQLTSLQSLQGLNHGKSILLHLKSECHGIFSQNLRHHKSKKIHFWRTKFRKILVGIYFVPTFYFIKKLIAHLFSVIFGQTDQPTVAGDVLAALLQCYYHIFF